MAENSAISWTDHTFNPWWGCTKVGPGCDHCYAESFDRRVGGTHWGVGAPRRLVKDWTKPRKWQREAERTGVRPWVFCASMADVFDNEVPHEWRARLWDLVRETSALRWIFVTKRIGNAAKMLPADWSDAFDHCGLMTTIVNQAEADRDIPKLLTTPAAWRGLSMEPLLGHVDLSVFMPNLLWAGVKGWNDDPVLDWIIVGGESGPGARPMHPDWARSLRDQCAAAGVPFHFKQWGAHQHGSTLGRRPDLDRIVFNDGRVLTDQREAACKAEYREHGWHKRRPEMMALVGKAAAGRLLDGVEHNGMPESTALPCSEASPARPA